MTTDAAVHTPTPLGQPGPSFQELLTKEDVDVPACLLESSMIDLRETRVPVHRYTSRAYYEAEVESLWSRVWQMACREEDIANVGDVHVYENVGRSVIIVRSAPDEIKAFPNACLHRGTELCADDGNRSELRCPFHGFCWRLDGELSDVPSPWDFPRLDPAAMHLPELPVDTWQGFVFINFDKDAPSLAEYLGGIIGHFDDVARPSLPERFKAVHVAKIMKANWKVALEAFLESYHVLTTHTQTMPYIGDANTQYDVYDKEANWNRMITPLGVPSPHLGPDVTEEDIAEALRRDQILLDVLMAPDASALAVPEGSTARRMLADFMRQTMRVMTGFDASNVTDAEMTDGIQYFVFPNFVPWPGVGAPLVYRFRPYDNSPDLCVMDIMLLYPVNPDQPRPPAAPVHWVGLEEDFSAAPELGGLAAGLNQDLNNIPRIQRGLRSTVADQILLADYQESRIKHFHEVLSTYVKD